MANPQGTSGGKEPGLGAQMRPTPENETHSAPDQGAAEAAKQEAADLGQHARDMADDVKHEAQAAAEQAKEHVRATADRQKNAAAMRMDGYAHALKAASEDLRQQGQDVAAAYVQRAAGGIERASSAVRQRDLDDLVGTVEDFARRQPVAFLGGAVVAGFGLARLMKSSADRRRSAAVGARSGEGGTA